MENEVNKRCDLNQFLTSNWVRTSAKGAGVTILRNEEYNYLLMCAATNAPDKELDKLHEMKEFYENV